MAYPQELLSNDEEIVLDLRPHWWAILPAILVLTGAIVLGIIVLVVFDGDWSWLRIPVGVLILVALVWFAQQYTKWTTTNFVVTNERVISRHGVVAKSGIEIPLDRINTVHFKQSLFERLIGAGDLSIESASEGGQQSFSNVRKPNLVQQEIYRMIEGFESRRLNRMGEAVAASQGPGAPPAPTESIPDQIAKLDQLRQQGVLSEAEFQAKKTDLLRRM
ncbi:MAG: PH domain-containing protein [Acidimicrobiales bacterium]|nr:PH domain-containing protein [Acidimicrobiales bacterium]